jgi:hypothetical protein
VPLQAGQLRGNVNTLLPSLLLLLLPLSGFQCRTMISPLPLHTPQSTVVVDTSNPDPCNSNHATCGEPSLRQNMWLCF